MARGLKIPAMSAPNTPADFKALISDPTSTMCGNFINTLLKLPVLLYKLVNYWLTSTGNPSKAFVNSALPTGSLMFSSCLQSESGGIYMLCDGREIDRTTYADLFAAIGTTYGTPSGGSVFKIPDFRAKFPVGIGTFAGGSSAALGVAGGSDTSQLVEANIPRHSHTLGSQDSTADVGGDVNMEFVRSVGTGTGPTVTTSTFGADPATSFPNLPPFLPCYVYIVL